ncbi:MAG: 3-isopropylmalate dehydratase small subunit, partial [Caldiserica bacterium]|nr:3-isopropylmalate dehydratase small subunit [Caldisericota bacterium]
MLIKGKVHKFGDNIDTDIIIPARYLVTTDIKELGTHCMEGVDAEFPRKVKAGDIIVAGENFGCGSSREHAPLSIKGCGVSLVIASSFARIFLRNSINVGLPIIISEEISKNAAEGDELEVDLAKGEIKNLTQGRIFKVDPFPQFLHQI